MYTEFAEPVKGINYTLWAIPYQKWCSYQVQLTENVSLGQPYLKLVSLFNNFWLHKGDYLNFQGKIVIVKETTFVTTNETILPVFNIHELFENDFTSTYALTLIASEASCSFDFQNTLAGTVNKTTGKFTRKAVTARELNIDFQGAFINGDFIAQYLSKRIQYYLELRNPVYLETRINTYMGIVEGVLSSTEDKIITLKGQFLANKNFREWELTGYLTNPRYCPTVPYSNFNPIIVLDSDTAKYCPLDLTGFFDLNYDIILEQDTAGYCPLVNLF